MEEPRAADLLGRDLGTAPEGTRVVGLDGAKLGEVVAVYRDRLIVERGFFFPIDYYVPFEAVLAYERGTIYLALSRDEALHQGWQTPPVDEVLPEPVAPAPAPTPPPTQPAAPTAASAAPATAEPLPGAVPVGPAAPAPPSEPAPLTLPVPLTLPTPLTTVAPPAGQPMAAPPAEGATEPALGEPAVDQPAESVAASLPPAPAAVPLPVDLVGPSPEPTAAADSAATIESAGDSPTPDETLPSTPSAVDPPFVATPTLTTEQSSTLSRLFPDLVGPSTADLPPGETPTDGDASATGSEPATPEPGDDRGEQ